jgi:hypothetical protein
MPAFTKLQTFVKALKTGRTHITDCFDDFFKSPATVLAHPNFAAFSSGSWSAGTPAWLPGFLDSIGLTPVERDHVLAWPPAELETARATAAGAVAAGLAPTFRWVLYDGAAPNSLVRTGTAGNPEVLFQSPGASLRLTQLNYGEIYVEEV